MKFLKAESEAILARVRANIATLDACTRHEFEPFGDRPILKEHRCKNCGGTVDYHGAIWYMRGLKHGALP